MSAVSAVSNKIYYTKKKMWRRGRVLFPSPAEVKFIRVMGGRTFSFSSVTSTKTGFPLTFIMSFGKTLRREYVQREVRVGAYYVDFAFVTRYDRKAIEIDGKAYHRDIVKEQQRDDYLMDRGWRVMHITASEVYTNPDAVQRRVIDFLSR
jgi:hypothetical protein